MGSRTDRVARLSARIDLNRNIAIGNDPRDPSILAHFGMAVPSAFGEIGAGFVGEDLWSRIAPPGSELDSLRYPQGHWQTDDGIGRGAAHGIGLVAAFLTAAAGARKLSTGITSRSLRRSGMAPDEIRDLLRTAGQSPRVEQEMLRRAADANPWGMMANSTLLRPMYQHHANPIREANRQGLSFLQVGSLQRGVPHVNPEMDQEALDPALLAQEYLMGAGLYGGSALGRVPTNRLRARIQGRARAEIGQNVAGEPMGVLTPTEVIRRRLATAGARDVAQNRHFYTGLDLAEKGIQTGVLGTTGALSDALTSDPEHSDPMASALTFALMGLGMPHFGQPGSGARRIAESARDPQNIFGAPPRSPRSPNALQRWWATRPTASGIYNRPRGMADIAPWRGRNRGTEQRNDPELANDPRPRAGSLLRSRGRVQPQSEQVQAPTPRQGLTPDEFRQEALKEQVPRGHGTVGEPIYTIEPNGQIIEHRGAVFSSGLVFVPQAGRRERRILSRGEWISRSNMEPIFQQMKIPNEPRRSAERTGLRSPAGRSVIDVGGGRSFEDAAIRERAQEMVERAEAQDQVLPMEQALEMARAEQRPRSRNNEDSPLPEGMRVARAEREARDNPEAMRLAELDASVDQLDRITYDRYGERVDADRRAEGSETETPITVDPDARMGKERGEIVEVQGALGELSRALGSIFSGRQPRRWKGAEGDPENPFTYIETREEATTRLRRAYRSIERIGRRIFGENWERDIFGRPIWTHPVSGRANRLIRERDTLDPQTGRSPWDRHEVFREIQRIGAEQLGWENPLPLLDVLRRTVTFDGGERLRRKIREDFVDTLDRMAPELRESVRDGLADRLTEIANNFAKRQEIIFSERKQVQQTAETVLNEVIGEIGGRMQGVRDRFSNERIDLFRQLRRVIEHRGSGRSQANAIREFEDRYLEMQGVKRGEKVLYEDEYGDVHERVGASIGTEGDPSVTTLRPRDIGDLRQLSSSAPLQSVQRRLSERAGPEADMFYELSERTTRERDDLRELLAREKPDQSEFYESGQARETLDILRGAHRPETASRRLDRLNELKDEYDALIEEGRRGLDARERIKEIVQEARDEFDIDIRRGSRSAHVLTPFEKKHAELSQQARAAGEHSMTWRQEEAIHSMRDKVGGLVNALRAAEKHALTMAQSDALRRDFVALRESTYLSERAFDDITDRHLRGAFEAVFWIDKITDPDAPRIPKIISRLELENVGRALERHQNELSRAAQQKADQIERMREREERSRDQGKQEVANQAWREANEGREDFLAISGVAQMKESGPAAERQVGSMESNVKTETVVREKDARWDDLIGEIDPSLLTGEKVTIRPQAERGDPREPGGTEKILVDGRMVDAREVGTPEERARSRERLDERPDQQPDKPIVSQEQTALETHRRLERQHRERLNLQKRIAEGVDPIRALSDALDALGYRREKPKIEKPGERKEPRSDDLIPRDVSDKAWDAVREWAENMLNPDVVKLMNRGETEFRRLIESLYDEWREMPGRWDWTTEGFIEHLMSQDGRLWQAVRDMMGRKAEESRSRRRKPPAISSLGKEGGGKGVGREPPDKPPPDEGGTSRSDDDPGKPDRDPRAPEDPPGGKKGRTEHPSVEAARRRREAAFQNPNALGRAILRTVRAARKKALQALPPERRRALERYAEKHDSAFLAALAQTRHFGAGQRKDIRRLTRQYISAVKGVPPEVRHALMDILRSGKINIVRDFVDVDGLWTRAPGDAEKFRKTVIESLESALSKFERNRDWSPHEVAHAAFELVNKLHDLAEGLHHLGLLSREDYVALWGGIGTMPLLWARTGRESTRIGRAIERIFATQETKRRLRRISVHEARAVRGKQPDASHLTSIELELGYQFEPAQRDAYRAAQEAGDRATLTRMEEALRESLAKSDAELEASASPAHAASVRERYLKLRDPLTDTWSHYGPHDVDLGSLVTRAGDNMVRATETKRVIQVMKGTREETVEGMGEHGRHTMPFWELFRTENAYRIVAEADGITAQAEIIKRMKQYEAEAAVHTSVDQLKPQVRELVERIAEDLGMRRIDRDREFGIENAIHKSLVDEVEGLRSHYMTHHHADFIEHMTRDYTGFKALYLGMMNAWRAGKTIWNPATHLRQAYFNVGQFGLRNGFLNSIPQLIHSLEIVRSEGYAKEIEALVSKRDSGTPLSSEETLSLRRMMVERQLYIESVSNANMMADYWNSEIRDLLHEGSGHLKLEPGMRGFGKFLAEFQQLASERLGRVYSLSDAVTRHANYRLRRLVDGMSVEDAIYDTNRYFQNYMNTPRILNQLNTWWAPFIKFEYEAGRVIKNYMMDFFVKPMMTVNTDNFLDQMRHTIFDPRATGKRVLSLDGKTIDFMEMRTTGLQPLGRFAAMMAIFSGLNAITRSQGPLGYGLEDWEWDIMDEATDYRNLWAIPAIPGLTKHRDPLFLDIGYIIPFGDLQRYESIPQWVGDRLILGNPFARQAVDITLNHDTWRDRPIHMGDGSRVARMSNYLWVANAPTLLGTGIPSIAETIGGENDYLGDRKSVTAELFGRLGGLSTVSMRPDQALRARNIGRNFETRERRDLARRNLSRLNQGRSSDRTFLGFSHLDRDYLEEAMRE